MIIPTITLILGAIIFFSGLLWNFQLGDNGPKHLVNLSAIISLIGDLMILVSFVVLGKIVACVILGFIALCVWYQIDYENKGETKQ
jgi:hypothetical protein